MDLFARGTRAEYHSIMIFLTTRGLHNDGNGEGDVSNIVPMFFFWQWALLGNIVGLGAALVSVWELDIKFSGAKRP